MGIIVVYNFDDSFTMSLRFSSHSIGMSSYSTTLYEE